MEDKKKCKCLYVLEPLQWILTSLVISYNIICIIIACCKRPGACNNKHCPCQKDNSSCGAHCGCSSQPETLKKNHPSSPVSPPKTQKKKMKKLPSSLDPEQEKKRKSPSIDDMLGRMHQGFSTYGETDFDKEIALGEGTTAIAEDTQVGEESPTSRAAYHPQDINDAEAIASSDNHDHPGSAAVATAASCDINAKETLITFTGSCWVCHSTEHKESKCPNAKDDKYDGNYEKNRMRYLELKAIEMKKEKTCCRCTTKKKLSEFFLPDWYKERVCKHCRKLEVKTCCRCMTKKKLPEFFQRDRDKDESQCVCKACRKLEVKVCNMCITWKKRHGFKKEQWDLNDESPRICKHCFKIIGGRFDEK